MTVKLKTAHGVVIRTIQRVFSLELSPNNMSPSAFQLESSSQATYYIKLNLLNIIFDMILLCVYTLILIPAHWRVLFITSWYLREKNVSE